MLVYTTKACFLSVYCKFIVLLIWKAFGEVTGMYTYWIVVWIDSPIVFKCILCMVFKFPWYLNHCQLIRKFRNSVDKNQRFHYKHCSPALHGFRNCSKFAEVTYHAELIPRFPWQLERTSGIISYIIINGTLRRYAQFVWLGIFEKTRTLLLSQ